jgi:hypothetical protein
LFLLFSCNNISYRDRLLRDNINKKACLDFVDYVYQNEEQYSLKQIRLSYDFLAIVFLQLDCNSCYEKYKKWNELFKEKNCAVLFVVGGANMAKFKKEFVSSVEIKPYAFVFSDEHLEYLKQNMKIPWSVINSTILIDSRNNIKIIGSPFTSAEIAKLYHEICVDRNHNN